MKKMRPTPVAFSDVAAIVKANLSGWYMLLALLFLSLFMSSCDTIEEQKEIEDNLASNKYTVAATAVSFSFAIHEASRNYLPSTC
ncbi:hypothetical protein WG947_12980 [Pontibacter sp. H259]|uniref:hypothetical protein n=1 Tax=Pontibacter sp. H259 TaxID=3133421 RepID=UPI0030C55461